MIGSPTYYWDKPAQIIWNGDPKNGDAYMARVIAQPGDTVFVHPNFVTKNDPQYKNTMDAFNKIWNKKAKPKKNNK